jgi:hypothetical protein
VLKGRRAVCALEDLVGLLEPAFHVATADLEVVHHVRADVGIQDEVGIGDEAALTKVLVERDGVGRERGLRVEVAGERVVFHLDPLQRRGRLVGLTGDDDRDRLPRVAHPVDRDERAVREDRTVVRCDASSEEVRAREHGDDAGHLFRGAGVQARDSPVRLRRAQHLRVQHARHLDVHRELGGAAHALASVGRGQRTAHGSALAGSGGAGRGGGPMARLRGWERRHQSAPRRRSFASMTASRILT